MKKIILVAIIILLVGCSDNEQKPTKETIQESNEPKSIELQSKKTTEPIDFEKAAEVWDEEIEEWYKASSMGAIEVLPMNEDYSHLSVIVHDNIQVLDEEGRDFIADDMTKDLQDLVKETFEFEGEVQVDFEFQDGSPLLSD